MKQAPVQKIAGTTRPSGQPEELTADEVAAYTCDLLKAARRVVKKRGSKQFAFLGYLLAMGEQEASNLAANVYH